MWTGDGRVFFYNPSSRTSVWERPEDLNGRADVDKMMQPPKQEPAETAAKDTSDEPPAKKAKTEDVKKGTSSAAKEMWQIKESGETIGGGVTILGRCMRLGLYLYFI